MNEDRLRRDQERGFLVLGMAAGFLKERGWGRVALWMLFIALVAFFGIAIYLAETKQAV